MKVSILLPDFQIIGAQRVAIDYGKKLQEVGFDVEWICGSSHVQNIEIEYQSVVFFHAILFSRVKYLRIIEQFLRLMHVVIGSNRDVFLSVTPLMNRYICFFKMLGLTDAKIIIEDHAYPPRSYPDEFPGIVKRLLFRKTEWVYCYSSIMRVLTKGTLKYYKNRFPNLNAIVYSNLLDLGRIRTLSLEATESKDYDIVYIGRFATQKNIPFLIETLKNYLIRNDSTMLIVGYGEMEGQLRKLVSDLCLDNYVTIKNTSKNNYYFLSRAKVFPLVSKWEGFPLVIIEAMALGVPVVSFDCKTGPREMLGDNSERGWLVPEGNSKYFVEAIDQAIKDGRTRDEKVRAAKDYVNQCLDIDSNFEDYLDTFFSKAR